MADLQFDANIRFLGEAKSERFYMNTDNDQTVYRGQPILISSSLYTDNVIGFVDSFTVAATDVCVGIAAEGKTVKAGDPETTELEVYVWPSIIGFKSTVFTQADLGKTVYMSDSGTLSGTAGDNPEIGTLFKVEDGYCYVALSGPKISSGA